MESLDYLCLNCQNLIRFDLVDRHSAVCKDVQQSLLLLEKDNSRLLDLKIDKLKCAVDVCDPQVLPADTHMLARLSQFCVALILSDADRLQEICENTAVELERILDRFQGSLRVRLYCERLRLLAQEKASEIANGPQESLEQRVERKRREAEALREKVEYYRKRSLAIGDVNSTLERGESWDESASSGSMTQRGEQMESDVQPHSASPNLQRYFYSQCLQVKMTLGTRHPAQSIPLPSLYDKAKRQAIPVEQWPDFIRLELGNASER